MGKRATQFFLMVFVFAFLLFVNSSQLTGFAVFSDSGNDFDLGIYNGTEFNGSSVVLVAKEGDYTSRVFSVNGSALWKSISVHEGIYSRSNGERNLSRGNSSKLDAGIFNEDIIRDSKGAGLIYLYRNCSSADCSDAFFIEGNISDINLEGRYFQYKTYFYSSSNNFVPWLSEVVIDYDEGLGVEIISPVNKSYDVSEIDLDFLVYGEYNACWYSLNSGITNKSIDDCQDVLLNLNDGEYQLDLYVNGSAEVYDSVSFSVEIPEDSGDEDNNGGSGGGGSGGGGSIGSAELSLIPIDILITERGVSEVVSLGVENTGDFRLDNCVVSVEGELVDWISNDETKSIGVRGKDEFFLRVQVPEDAEIREYSSDLIVDCDETNALISFSLILESKGFDFLVLDSYRDGTFLVTEYYIEDLSGADQEISLAYELSQNQNLIAEGVEEIFLEANTRQDKVLELDISEESGEFSLVFSIEGEIDSEEVEYPVSVPSITGFAVSDDNVRNLSIFGVILVAFILIVLAVRFIHNHHKGISESKVFSRKIELKNIDKV